MRQRPFNPRLTSEPPMPNPSKIGWLSSLEAYKPSLKELTSHMYAKFSKNYWEAVSIRQYIYRKTLQKNIQDVRAKEAQMREVEAKLEESIKRRNNKVSRWDSSFYTFNLNDLFRKESPHSNKLLTKGPSMKDNTVLPISNLPVSIPCNCIPPYIKR